MKKFMLAVLVILVFAVNCHGGEFDFMFGVWSFKIGNRDTGVIDECFLEIGETSIIHDGPDGRDVHEVTFRKKDKTNYYIKCADMDRGEYHFFAMPDRPNQMKLNFSESGSFTELYRSSAEAREAKFKGEKREVPKGYSFDCSGAVLLQDGKPFGVIQSAGLVSNINRDESNSFSAFNIIGHISKFIK